MDHIAPLDIVFISVVCSFLAACVGIVWKGLNNASRNRNTSKKQSEESSKD